MPPAAGSPPWVRKTQHWPQPLGPGTPLNDWTTRTMTDGMLPGRGSLKSNSWSYFDTVSPWEGFSGRYKQERKWNFPAPTRCSALYLNFRTSPVFLTGGDLHRGWASLDAAEGPVASEQAERDARYRVVLRETPTSSRRGKRSCTLRGNPGKLKVLLAGPRSIFRWTSLLSCGS